MSPKKAPSINNLFIKGEISPEKKAEGHGFESRQVHSPTQPSKLKIIKAIRISPAMQKGNIGKDKFCTFTILVKETNPFYKWYHKAVSMGWYKIREKLEVPA